MIKKKNNSSIEWAPIMNMIPNFHWLKLDVFFIEQWPNLDEIYILINIVYILFNILKTAISTGATNLWPLQVCKCNLWCVNLFSLFPQSFTFCLLHRQSEQSKWCVLCFILLSSQMHKSFVLFPLLFFLQFLVNQPT